ncbi:methyltransferase domain-containing protein [Paenibacillus peoriae]|uniref:methyltransferase domain-containing protein n=1 Tax=Paenibacillus peoriae TaxID=59893 RepID=UPI003F9A5D11
MTITKCSFCSYIYDEWHGDSRNGVPAGTSIRELAGTVCSRCGIQGMRHERQLAAPYVSKEAEHYDLFAGKSGISFYKNWLEKSTYLPTVVELGVGTGRLAAELAGVTARYTGIDTSPDMLKIADKKRGRIFGETAKERLELVEEDVRLYNTDAHYSHVLCTDGFMQHFTYMQEHIALLDHISQWLQEGGWLAVDIIIPPNGINWEIKQRKALLQHKWVNQKVDGETWLSRQIYRSTISFEVYTNGMMDSRYQVEREYALMTPKEVILLLGAKGFQVKQVVENYGLSTPWQTVMPFDLDIETQSLDAEESIRDGIEAGKNVLPYRQGEWSSGQYPFSGIMQERSANTATVMTFIAQKKSK